MGDILENPLFWRWHQLLLGLLYVAAAALALTGHASHFVPRLALVLVGIHVLELPMAFQAVRGRAVAVVPFVVGTLLFGFFWWLPIRRGVYAGTPAAR